jgi:hypothetical protein
VGLNVETKPLGERRNTFIYIDEQLLKIIEMCKISNK